MGYGFLIDHRKCIGCHACTVACKSENDVPVGSFRTWVKYTEKGAFPEVRRHFTVLRCNHCDAAPCVEICPVEALHKRPDAIVDLDRDLCIGCRACMQACPYDALYLNEDSGVAEKCHYCAHRTELGLEPACVVVCPERAIVPGDVDDPESEIAALISEQPTSRRKVEKGTEPRVWYVDALEESLVPGAAAERKSWLFADRLLPPEPTPPGFEPPRECVTTLDVDHPHPWGWHVWTYLLTKNVAAGAGIVAPFLGWLGVAGGAARWLPEAVALVFLGITSVLLVHDLGRPERFLKILTHANSRSWLVKGTWVLMAFGLVTTLAFATRLLGAGSLAEALRWLNVPAAIMASGYSAFLFAQCKGRDLWVERGLFTQLVLRAALAGSAFALLLPSEGSGRTIGALLFMGLAFLTAAGMAWERLKPRSEDLAERAEAVLRESLRSQAAVSLLILAAVFVQVSMVLNPGVWQETLRLVAVVLAVVGLYDFERAWIRAGQRVPIS